MLPQPLVPHRRPRHIDEDGFLYFVDRKKDYLRRRGENISSFEMEKVFQATTRSTTSPCTRCPSAHRRGRREGHRGAQPGARRSPRRSSAAGSLDRVPYFAVPRYIEFRADLPRNPVGRVLKYQLRDEGVTDATWDRETSGFTFERR